MRIAFFDSGIGGITVLAEAMRRLPQEDYLYFADTLHVPYGTKSKEDVLDYVKKSVDTIIQHDVKALVIACNTATSIAVADLRSTYGIPIIGMEPAVKPALEMNRSTGKRVLVFATPLTLKQTKYLELISRIDDQHMVDSLPLPELVEFCEALQFNPAIITAYFQEKLTGFDLSLYGTVVLGCTHFPFYKDLLRSILPDHIQIVDGSSGAVNRLKHVMEEEGNLGTDGQAEVAFLCSNQDPVYMKKMQDALAIIRNRATKK
ncbi:glutamate racemase [Paenibacillus hexagrammi]|uniref:Glutamate racemase n=1 Tax=Paenibacillus hexagrammi TaxID=2908839 RepID=A0ABY3SES9_9BACL|nr:glutamate racemase [Paenibacillus sp. YPD9-1]UJF32494.1 glutamate racemase [Paenibacillus sp. YPD9-1]